MKKLILFLFPLFVLYSLAPAAASNFGNYLALRVGYVTGASSHFDDDSFSGIGGTIAYGQSTKARSWLDLRAEGELIYHTQTHDDVRLTPMGVNLNFYADFGDTEWLLKPYAGLGFGGKLITVTDQNDKNRGYGGIAWNAQTGITFNFSEDLKLDAGLRYDMTSTLDFTLHNYVISAGVRWYF